MCELPDADPGRRTGRGDPRLVAVAVGISEPGNAGTLIRIADAMGAAAVVLAGHAWIRTTASACAHRRAASSACRSSSNPTRSPRSPLCATRVCRCWPPRSTARSTSPTPRLRRADRMAVRPRGSGPARGGRGPGRPAGAHRNARQRRESQRGRRSGDLSVSERADPALQRVTGAARVT